MRKLPYPLNRSNAADNFNFINNELTNEFEEQIGRLKNNMDDSDPSKTIKEHSQNFDDIGIKKNVVLDVKKMVCCLHCRSYFQDIQALSNHVQIRVQCRIKENFDSLENHQNFLNPSSAGLNYPSKLTPSHPPLSAVFSETIPRKIFMYRQRFLLEIFQNNSWMGGVQKGQKTNFCTTLLKNKSY